MLKIKDNVSLEELEKFGFVELNKGYYSSKRYSHLLKSQGSVAYKIVIEKLTRKMHFNIPTKQTYDVLFDLIQAGLVEKVEE